MSNAYTASTDLTTLPKFYDKVFLERLQPGPILMDYCLQKPLPTGSGTTAFFPRMSVSSTTVSAYKVTQGTVISTEKIADAQISAVVEQFANAKALWDLTELTAISTTVEETVKEIADQAKNIIDKRIRDEAYGTSSIPYNAGFSVQFSNFTAGTDWVNSSAGAALQGTSKSITAAMVRQWVKIMKQRNVQPLDNGFYALVCHSDTAMALQADSSWQTAYQYTDPENIRKGIAGTYAGALVQIDNNVFLSANGSSGASNYYSILLGHGGMGVTMLDGGVKTYTKRSGDQDTSNPVNQFITFGWKIHFVPVRLNLSCGLICVTCDQ